MPIPNRVRGTPESHIKSINLLLLSGRFIELWYIINPSINSILDFTYDDFNLIEYDPHSHIKAAVSI